MITFNSLTNFDFKNKLRYKKWLSSVIDYENFKEGALDFIFCDDLYLHGLNLKFLNHDTLTDILTFDYNEGNEVNAEIYISHERVAENAKKFKTSFSEELARVLVHGILHLCGYCDSTNEEKKEIRQKEDFYLSKLFSQ